NNSNGHFQIFGRRYNGTWENIFAVDTSNTSNLSVQAAIDSLNRVWLVWHRWDNNQSDIFYSYYDGSNWLSPEPITSDPEDDILPSITVDGLGRPWVCWMSDRDGNWNIYHSYYDNGWNSPQAVTTDTSCDIDPSIICVDSLQICITWASNRNNYWNIYAAFTDITAVQEKELHSYKKPMVRALPNPFYDAILFESSIPFELDIYNITGRLMKRFNNNKKTYIWKPKGLAQGVYFARIRTKFNEKYLKIIYIK
ncbi:T9SS type A sorting domain-containing protein, partial [candidate division WOR-3 bacterium]|nr:T9SS type A sorting domain-containing protein [candidate division WOR-3 bacterium]